ncbi:hypothetical protein [Nocardia sienata]|uniref:hypothetical protein n=1 Tax=Nocardia sienata TaxID=248552 RepID=UPI0012ED7C80|nr:hypothetical protein [Nocardia sienata]
MFRDRVGSSSERQYEIGDGAADMGWAALDTLRECRKYGNHPMAGRIDPGSAEYQASTLAGLKRMAGS